MHLATFVADIFVFHTLYVLLQYETKHHQLLAYVCDLERCDRKFLHLPSRIDSLKYSFFPRAIRLWNHLPDYIVETDVNIDTFKHLLTS